jgi:hypothetical protein
VDWQAIQDQIAAVLRAASGESTLDVRFDEASDAAGWRSDRLVRVRLIAIRGDSHEARYVDGASQITPRIYGPRVLVLQILVETPRQSLVNTAEALAEKLRTGIRLPAALEALAVAGLGLARVGSVSSVPFSDGATGRQRSAASFETEHNAASVVVGAAMDWIASVGLEGELGPSEPPREVSILVETPGAPVPDP